MLATFIFCGKLIVPPLCSVDCVPCQLFQSVLFESLSYNSSVCVIFAHMDPTIPNIPFDSEN